MEAEGKTGRREQDARMTGLAVSAAAVIGSHHSAAIFATSPPIFSDCLFLSGRRVTEEEAMRAARELDTEQLDLVSGERRRGRKEVDRMKRSMSS